MALDVTAELTCDMLGIWTSLELKRKAFIGANIFIIQS